MDNTFYKVDDLNLKQHTTNLIINKRASGKKKLVLNLIKYYIDKYDYNYIYLFSKTGEFNEDWNFLDNKYKDDLTDEKLDNIIEFQKKQIMKKKKVYSLIILDDVKIVDKSKALASIFTLGRHFYITILVSLQFSKYICSPIIRSNVDYMFFSDVSNDSLEPLYYCLSTRQLFKNFKEFAEYVDNNNDNYQFIFYNNREHNKKRRIILIKAQLLNNLKFI